MNKIIKFEKLYFDAIIPTRQTELAIGYDAHAYINGRVITIYESNNRFYILPESTAIFLPPTYRVLIPLGFKATLPEGIEAQVRSRSGNVLKKGLLVANQPGTIDPDYSEEWGVILWNTSSEPTTINHGDRIAQIVFNKVEYLDWEKGTVDGTTRSGFGSTGQ